MWLLFAFININISTSVSISVSPRRLQSGMNLQICFVNDSGSDKDSDADDSKTETSLDTPLSPMVGTVARLEAHTELLENFSRMQEWKQSWSHYETCVMIYKTDRMWKWLDVWAILRQSETESSWGRYSLWIRFSCCMNVFAHVFWPVNQFMGSKWEVNWNTLATAMDEWPH